MNRSFRRSSHDVNSARTADLAVVGGGLVGTAVAWGAARLGLKVVVLDGADIAFRASRGNFGLVWVQGKGYGHAPYARWTMKSARLWPQMAARLQEETGIDVQLRQPGGYHICLSEPDLAARLERLHGIREALHGDYPFTFLSAEEGRRRLPGLGPTVIGVSHGPLDGHLNPLKLLRALHTACHNYGVAVHNGFSVDDIAFDDGTYRVRTAGGTVVEAARVVLAAGLGNRSLAPMVGLRAPVVPNRGQVLVTERVARFLDVPTTHIRQTDEGSIQLGESMEEVGLDDTTTTEVLSAIAMRAVRSFPVLRDLQLVRVWSALRVMSPDGSPIYAESPTHPGAFVVTCHSGVTLGAAHALELPSWIAGGVVPEGLEAFTDRRFSPATASARA